MTLKVIGSGFGRTGTLSLKTALEIRGFGPCHHMDEVLDNPPQVALWQALHAGQDIDLARVFEGYGAQVDWPGCHIWRQSAERFPQARVVHSTRSEEAWWNSYSVTIGKFMRLYRSLPIPPHIHDMMVVTEGFLQATMQGDLMDRETCLAAFRARRAEVEAALPPERLLVFDVAEGWEPLCAFLGVPVPDQPFPRTNTRVEFWRDLGGEPGRPCPQLEPGRHPSACTAGAAARGLDRRR